MCKRIVRSRLNPPESGLPAWPFGLGIGLAVGFAGATTVGTEVETGVGAAVDARTVTLRG
jgi:hypothetical protein